MTTAQRIARDQFVIDAETYLTLVGYVNPKFLIDYNPAKTFTSESISLKHDSITNLEGLKKGLLKNQQAFESSIIESLFQRLFDFLVTVSCIEETVQFYLTLTEVEGVRYFLDADLEIEVSGEFLYQNLESVTVYITDADKTTTGITSLVNEVVAGDTVTVTFTEDTTITGVLTVE